MIGYVLEQELGDVMPPEAPLATILTMVQVDPKDPAFQDPTKFVGPIYAKAEADVLHAAKGWVFKPDGDSWRRVVPSPEPMHIFEIDPIRWLLEHDVVTVCAGGVPTMFLDDNEQTLVGVEAVIDKDLASELLAREVGADLYVMATDVDAVYTDWGTPQQQALGRVTTRSSAGPRSRPARWDPRSMQRAASSKRPVGGPRSARSHRSSRSSREQRAPRWCQERRSDDHVRGSLRGRTPATGDGPPPGAQSPASEHPSTHDALLFDDVLWVERAQYEHDQFVARMRERGVEVFLLQTLLAESLAASDGGGTA